MKLGFGLLMQGNFGENPLKGIWEVWSSERDLPSRHWSRVTEVFLGTTLSKVLKRVYGEGRPSEWNVGMSEERVFQKEFWDFLGAGGLRVILWEDCEGWAGRSSTEDLREPVKENSRRKISRKSLLVRQEVSGW